MNVQPFRHGAHTDHLAGYISYSISRRFSPPILRALSWCWRTPAMVPSPTKFTVRQGWCSVYIIWSAYSLLTPDILLFKLCIGDEALVVGSGDQHDSTYDHWKRDGAFTSLGSTLQDGTSGGIPLHNEGCQYTIRVYPSQLFYEEYNTSIPAITTLALVAGTCISLYIFLVCLAVVTHVEYTPFLTPFVIPIFRSLFLHYWRFLFVQPARRTAPENSIGKSNAIHSQCFYAWENGTRAS